MHIPNRMCIACRQMKPKDELIRFVKGSEGAVVDENKKMPGRGAYICRKRECIEAAVKRKSLSKHFKANIDTAVLTKLLEETDG